MSEKKRPKRDGSGRGVRANIGRSGCEETEPIGRGRDNAFDQYRGFFSRFGRGYKNRR